MQSSADSRPFIFDVTEDTSIADALAQYARAGMRITFANAPIFNNDGTVSCTCGRADCASPGKHPVGKGWQKNASGELDVLRDQLARIAFTPSLGIVLGEQPCGEYLVAVDVDDAAREGELAEQFGALPVSLTCHSARGRRVFFRLGEGQQADRIKNVTALGGAPGVDVKAQNGFVVIAPSMHPARVRFRWELATVATLPPEWYLAIATPPKPPVELRSYTPTTLAADKNKLRRAERWLEAAVTRECAELSRCQKGQRNTVLFTTACNLLRAARGSRVATGRGYVLRELERAAIASGLAALEVGKTLESADETVEKSGEERGPKLELVASEGKIVTSSAGVSSSGSAAPADCEMPREVELILDEARRAAPIAENVGRLLAGHLDWMGGPHFDEFRREVWWPANTPLGKDARALRDTDAVLVQGWLLSRPYQDRVKAGLDVTLSGIEWVAHKTPFDSLRDHVLGLPEWDGKTRALWRYLGADGSDVLQVIGQRWLVGAIARALEPGCTFGGMLILEGAQESYKNRGLEALFGTKFYAELGSIKIGGRDAEQLTESTWCLHDDELKSKDAEIDQLKSFITRRNNSYVPKYGRNVVHIARRCALVGSTNRGQYLQDEENRRFWPLRVVRRVDVDGLARDREQLLAEALVAFKANTPWWISPDDAAREALRAEQADRVVSDPMLDAVRGALEKHPDVAARVTTHMIATWLGVPTERTDRQFEMRMGRVLRDLGYARKRIMEDGARGWRFEKVGQVGQW